MPNSQKRHAFIVSDRTGLTAEAMAHSLLSQFPSIDFNTETFTFVDTSGKAADLVARCHSIRDSTGVTPLVFLTMVNDKLRAQFTVADIEVFDLFHTFIGPMEERLGVKSSIPSVNHMVSLTKRLIHHGLRLCISHCRLTMAWISITIGRRN